MPLPSESGSSSGGIRQTGCGMELNAANLELNSSRTGGFRTAEDLSSLTVLRTAGQAIRALE
jgi:hypothetical protein